MSLNARNRSWSNEDTAILAEGLDERGFEDSVSGYIDESEEDGKDPEWIRDGIGNLIYQELQDIYEGLLDDADAIESMMISHPSRLKVDYDEIADAYMDCLATRSCNARSGRPGAVPGKKAPAKSRCVKRAGTTEKASKPKKPAAGKAPTKKAAPGRRRP